MEDEEPCQDTVATPGKSSSEPANNSSKTGRVIAGSNPRSVSSQTGAVDVAIVMNGMPTADHVAGGALCGEVETPLPPVPAQGLACSHLAVHAVRVDIEALASHRVSYEHHCSYFNLTDVLSLHRRATWALLLLPPNLVTSGRPLQQMTNTHTPLSGKICWREHEYFFHHCRMV